MRAGNSLQVNVENDELGLEDEEVYLLVDLTSLDRAFDVLLKLVQLRFLRLDVDVHIFFLVHGQFLFGHVVFLKHQILRFGNIQFTFLWAPWRFVFNWGSPCRSFESTWSSERLVLSLWQSVMGVKATRVL